MADLRGFYSTDDKPSTGYEVLPAGTYMVKITDAGWKDSKSKNDDGSLKGGKYLQFDMVVTEGEHQGALITDRLNLDNPNTTAVRIARGQFAALREAVGILEPRNETELCGIRFQVTLKCEKSEYTNQQTGEIKESWQNRITRYLKRDASVTTPQQQNDAPPYARNSPPIDKDEIPF